MSQVSIKGHNRWRSDEFKVKWNLLIRIVVTIIRYGSALGITNSEVAGDALVITTIRRVKNRLLRRLQLVISDIRQVMCAVVETDGRLQSKSEISARAPSDEGVV